MDPITVTTTLITLATFVKDLIEVGQDIQSSIEKVGENRRRIRELTNDVLRTLADLANLIRGHENTFQAPALLSAIGNLKAEMLHVLSVCREISSMDHRPGLRGFKTQIKAWMKRDDLEGKIVHLKEHVNRCYLQFTAFSAARIEQSAARIEDTSLETINTTLRVEQTIMVNNVENQVKLHRLEGMMAQVLLETQFGQGVLNKTMEIIASDSTHKSLEFQYLSVQTMRLIDSLQQLLAGGKLVLKSSFCDPSSSLNLVFAPEYTCAVDVLHTILGTVRDLNKGLTEIAEGIMANLGVHLVELRMTSEGTAWHLFKICFLRDIASNHCSAQTLVQLVNSFNNLSIGYHRQLRHEAALSASQQAFDLCSHLTESFPEMDNRPLRLNALLIHTENLLLMDQTIAALAIAEDAVAVSRPMVKQFIESNSGLSSLTEAEEYRAATCYQAFSVLAKALSSMNRPLQSYEAFTEGFHVIRKLPVFLHAPSGEDLDSFLHQICKVAEDGSFSLGMLADCVILFRDLVRMYPQTSSQFLGLLHAYVYFAQQDTSPNITPSMENLRVFLEPRWECPPPSLDITMRVEFDALGGTIIEDAVRAYYLCPAQAVDLLIRNIFVTHPEQAIDVLREVVEKSSFESSTILWVVSHRIAETVPLIPNSNRVAMLQIVTTIIKHFDTIFSAQGFDWPWVLHAILAPLFQLLWCAGLLEEAFAESEQAIRYLQSCSSTDDPSIGAELCWFRMSRHFLLCDMGRFLDTVEMIKSTDAIIPHFEEFTLHPYIVLTRILRRAHRKEEALQLLRRGVAAGIAKDLVDDGKPRDYTFHFLLVELAAAWRYVGHQKRAVEDAERAVAACRKVDDDVEAQSCTLVHALTTLSDCLAAVGRHDDAFKAAEEAVSIYTQHASHMWDGFLYTIRKQELGANAFHSLSLRLETIEKREEALIEAEKASALYRELVSLAPRHLPALANSLQNVASILSNTGRQEEAVAVCEETVSIMRNLVDPEPYFLPALAGGLDLLAGYLAEKGDVNGAASRAAESVEVRRTFACLPPQPKYLFEEVEMKWDEEGDESLETSEGDDSEHHEALDTAADEVVVSETESEHSIDVLPESSPTSTSLAATPDENPTPVDTAVPAKSHFKAILSTPLEIRLSMRSTLMDILWWLLVGILFIAFVSSRLA
ncbi:Tetratricopeptide repeat family [Mycena venus]|uniref:Tetratricopeptide repeat family n=1 Tax=Mycena venus TaxID=2733690 RepID=A0A8H7D3R9_9AGAR|nr:Tetratricopeptide repeat family [Mycena venus]